MKKSRPPQRPTCVVASRNMATISMNSLLTMNVLAGRRRRRRKQARPIRLRQHDRQQEQPAAERRQPREQPGDQAHADRDVAVRDHVVLGEQAETGCGMRPLAICSGVRILSRSSWKSLQIRSSLLFQTASCPRKAVCLSQLAFCWNGTSAEGCFLASSQPLPVVEIGVDVGLVLFQEILDRRAADLQRLVDGFLLGLGSVVKLLELGGVVLQLAR